MSVQVKHRRDTAANIAVFTPAQGELIVDTTNNRVIVGDGTTAGGWAAAKLSEISTSSRRAVADANATVSASDRLIAYATLTAARTITLCSAAVFPTGTLLRVVDETGNCSAGVSLTVASAGADTINGSPSFVINGAYMSVAIESDGVSKWTLLDNATADGFKSVGIGTAPDPGNPLSVYGSSALFNGTSFSFTINKAAAANTASILFQDGFSARAQIGLLGSDNFSFKVSANGSTYATGMMFDSATGAATFGNARTAVSDANYAALATDREISYTSISAARVVTLPAASAFPAGHALLIVDESGSVSLTNTISIVRAGSDTISGQTGATIVVPYGFCRLVSNGANGWVAAGRSVNVQIFSASGSYKPTAGLVCCEVFLTGGGGGGGGGALQTVSAAVSGGGGGGGGGGNFGKFTASQIGASQTITIGAGGTAGAAATASSTAGGTGGAGGTTSLGALLSGYGGGGGSGGQPAGASGGGAGGGMLGLGGNGSSGSGGGGTGGGGAGGAGGSGAAGQAPGAGAGGGGGLSTGASSSGGAGYVGTSGGGSGGGITAANAVANGGASGAAAIAGTSAAGGAGAGSAGTSPALATRAFNLFAGSGGAGGASSSTAAFTGGAGGAPGGGGGGGGSAQNGGTAGPGGAGGAGYAILIEYF